MIIFKHAGALHAFCLSNIKKGITTGFVPTMGALHSGHIGLLNIAQASNEIVLCSIFVNPTQFNDPRDFEQYPSTTEKDIFLLERAGCHVLFLPTVNDVYPNGVQSNSHYDLGDLETTLEGKFRPGHFQGVCQVVQRLLEIANPTRLYLGQKDIQQCLVLKKLLELTGMRTSIIICPTRREADGLAMSSRNLRLNEADRKTAPRLFEGLLLIKNTIQPGNVAPLTIAATTFLEEAGFRVEYVSITKAGTLEVIAEWDGITPLLALAAAYLGGIRLIDNLMLHVSDFNVH